MTDNSWVSALVDGRVTGSGAIFGGQQNPFAAGWEKVKADGEAAAKAAAGQAVQNGVNAASPGAVIVTRDTQIALAAGGVALAILLSRKKK